MKLLYFITCVKQLLKTFSNKLIISQLTEVKEQEISNVEDEYKKS